MPSLSLANVVSSGSRMLAIFLILQHSCSELCFAGEHVGILLLAVSVIKSTCHFQISWTVQPKMIYQQSSAPDLLPS